MTFFLKPDSAGTRRFNMKKAARNRKAFPIIIALLLSAALICALPGCAPEARSSGQVDPAAGGEPSPGDAAAETPTLPDVSDPAGEAETEVYETMKLYMEVNGRTLTATLADNSSAQALSKLLAEGPLTLELHDYANFEKVGPLPQSLPTNDEPINTEPGDLILYQGDQFSLYYDQNSWTFTRLGHVDDVTKEDLLSLLGSGDVTVTLSLAP